MTDFDPEKFFEQTSVETRLGGAPAPEPPLSSVGAGAQAELLDQLATLRASIEIIEGLIRNSPRNDQAFDVLNKTFGDNLEAARAALLRFYERRDCEGQA